MVVGTVNANREYFETGVRDVAECAFQWPGWLSRLLTHRIEGLENYDDIGRFLMDGAPAAIKVFVRV